MPVTIVTDPHGLLPTTLINTGALRVCLDLDRLLVGEPSRVENFVDVLLEALFALVHG